MDSVGLVVGRFQPLHFGHTKIINHMIQDCKTAIVCIGSAQESRTGRNPWSVEERMQMLRNVYADRVKIVPLNDLGAANPDQWVGYIFEKIEKLGMKLPTDYFTGSDQDSFWYREHFSYNWKELKAGHDGIRRLHIINRNINPVPAATEIRGFLELRNNGWKDWVPAVNHSIIEINYPEEFKVPLK